MQTTSLLNPKRTFEVNISGSLNLLDEYIRKENINADAGDVISTMPLYTQDFTENQKNVFKAFYWRQMSISSIYYQFGFKSINEVERLLKSATDKYLEMLKAEYGTK